MKILFVIDSINYAGASKMLVETANAMSCYDHNVAIFSYANNLALKKISSRVKYFPGKSYINNKYLRHFLKIFSIRKIIKEFRPDIVISFMPYPGILSVLASLGLKNKTIFCERGDPAVYKGFIKLFGHRILNHSTGAVFQTEGARFFYKNKRLYDDSVIIPNPISVVPERCFPLSERNNEIALVARLSVKQKRQDIAFMAFKKVLSRYNDLHLVLYGDGEDEEYLRKLSKDLGIDCNVVFKGKVDNIRSLLIKTRLLLLTSDYEGIPNALLEGMALGLPCISTDCSPGGARLIIDNNINGIIVPCGDVDAIAKAIISVIENPTVSEQLGREAVNKMKDFSPERIFDMWNNYLLTFCDKTC